MTFVVIRLVALARCALGAEQPVFLSGSSTARWGEGSHECVCWSGTRCAQDTDGVLEARAAGSLPLSSGHRWLDLGCGWRLHGRLPRTIAGKMHNLPRFESKGGRSLAAESQICVLGGGEDDGGGMGEACDARVGRRFRPKAWRPCGRRFPGALSESGRSRCCNYLTHRPLARLKTYPPASQAHDPSTHSPPI